MKNITSPHNPRLKAAMRLKTSRGRKIQRRIIIFGYRELHRAVQSGIKILEVFMDGPRVTAEQFEWLESLQNPTTIVYELPSKLFAKLKYGERHDGLVAVAQRPKLDLAKLKLAEDPLVIVLEAVEKPGNIGAILRSADGAGASAMILAEPQCDPFHPNCIRSSLGTVFSMPLASATNQEIGHWCRAHDMQIICASDRSPKDYTSVDWTKATAIVFGNEAVGLSDFWFASPNAQAVSIPMNGVADSLNVSVAAGIMLYEARRQRSS